MIDRSATRLLGAAAIVLALAAGSAASAEPVQPPEGATVSSPLILASGALAQLDTRRPGELPMEVRQSIGCLLVGAAGTTVTLSAGALNLVTAFAGGAVAAQGAGALYLGLTGVIFGAFCAVGAAMTPLYVYLTAPRQPARPAQQERHASEPRVPVAFVPADDVRSAAFRSGVLTNALAQREPAR